RRTAPAPAAAPQAASLRAVPPQVPQARPPAQPSWPCWGAFWSGLRCPSGPCPLDRSLHFFSLDQRQQARVLFGGPVVPVPGEARPRCSVQFLVAGLPLGAGPVNGLPALPAPERLARQPQREQQGERGTLGHPPRKAGQVPAPHAAPPNRSPWP